MAILADRFPDLAQPVEAQRKKEQTMHIEID
jgi:hypothetical protein